jgi:TATA box binding protein associated factor (TAF)
LSLSLSTMLFTSSHTESEFGLPRPHRWMSAATAISRESILVVAQQIGLDAGGEEKEVFSSTATGARAAASSASAPGAQESRPRPALTLEAAAILAPDTEYRVREVIQAAVRFMRRSRREVLTAEDVNAALRMRRVPQLFGYSAAAGSHPDASGGDRAGGIRFARAHGAPGTYFIEDRVLSTSDILDAELPPLPRFVGCFCFPPLFPRYLHFLWLLRARVSSHQFPRPRVTFQSFVFLCAPLLFLFVFPTLPFSRFPFVPQGD